MVSECNCLQLRSQKQLQLEKWSSIAPFLLAQGHQNIAQVNGQRVSAQTGHHYATTYILEKQSSMVNGQSKSVKTEGARARQAGKVPPGCSKT